MVTYEWVWNKSFIIDIDKSKLTGNIGNIGNIYLKNSFKYKLYTVIVNIRFGETEKHFHLIY